jgi:hypothetical protein
MTRIVCHQTIVLSDCENGQSPAVPHHVQSWTNRSCCPHRTQGSAWFTVEAGRTATSICSRSSISIYGRTSIGHRVEQLSTDPAAACTDWRALVTLCLHAHYSTNQCDIAGMSELVMWKASASDNALKRWGPPQRQNSVVKSAKCQHLLRSRPFVVFQ